MSPMIEIFELSKKLFISLLEVVGLGQLSARNERLLTKIFTVEHAAPGDVGGDLILLVVEHLLDSLHISC